MRALAGVLVVVAALLVVVAAAPAAEAAGYRYWSYWLKAGAGPWTYAQTGPAMHTPKDGTVEGWRFAVSKDAADKAAQPRGTADFATICAATPAREGMKRIALVIDAGTASDAPGGEAPPAQRTACARVAKNASSADALATVARPLRYDSAGILCAIAGYPAAGCGEQVSGTTHTNASAKRKSGGPSVGVYAGVAAVVVLAGAAVWQTRRRRP
ncbi:SCO2322 family protein [Actinacidiphila alni]|uniref:SCO2322 family protein n=1 Tax=Actinacidiphila alni TaxID=380248 RepID=UPI003452A86D